jgi:hypothetical protein
MATAYAGLIFLAVSLIAVVVGQMLGFFRFTGVMPNRGDGKRIG